MQMDAAETHFRCEQFDCEVGVGHFAVYHGHYSFHEFFVIGLHAYLVYLVVVFLAAAVAVFEQPVACEQAIFSI